MQPLNSENRTIAKKRWKELYLKLFKSFIGDTYAFVVKILKHALEDATETMEEEYEKFYGRLVPSQGLWLNIINSI